VYLALGWTFLQLYPASFIGAFTDDVTLLEEGVLAIRKLSVVFPVIGIPIMIVGTFQAIGKAKYALFLTANRTLILLIPLLIFLPPWIGTDGVWYAFPIADVLATLLNIIVFCKVYRTFSG